MATEHALSSANLGTVLETYGGKSLKRIVAIGATVIGSGLTASLLVRFIWPDYRVLAIVILGIGTVIGLAYVSTTWMASIAKVEVCTGGLRLIRRTIIVELTWNRIRKIEAGRVKARAAPEHVVIQTTDGNDIELPLGFWDAVGGASRFAKTAHRFVKNVELDVRFLLKRN
jgi:hypothetical protein